MSKAGWPVEPQDSQPKSRPKEKIPIGSEPETEDYDSWLVKAARLRQQDAYEELLRSCTYAKQQFPDRIDIWLNIIWTLQRLNCWHEALENVDEALRFWPGCSKVLSSKAHLLESMRRYDHALRIYDEILKSNPRDACALTMRGLLLRRLNRIGDANRDLAAALDQANADDSSIRAIFSSVFPAEDPVWHWLGKEPLNLKQPSPTLKGCLLFLRTLFLEAPSTQERQKNLLEALEHEPRLIGARMHLAEELNERGLTTEAIQIIEGLISDFPEDLRFRNNLGSCHADLGNIDIALELIDGLVDSDDVIVAHNKVFFRNYDPLSTPSIMRTKAQESGRYLLNKAGYAGGRAPGRLFTRRQVASQHESTPLRVGFLGGDFNLHPVGLMLSGILAKVKPERLCLFLYSSHADKADYVNSSLREIASLTGGEYRQVSRLRPEAQSALIKADNIDILIDISGHSENSALAAFAHRPAPVQISWPGYFSTTGLPTIDFTILDPRLAEAGVAEEFTEEILLLEPSRFCYSPIPMTPTVASSPVAAKGWVTFGSFNNTSKLNREVLRVWRTLLGALPESRLLLKWRTLADKSFRDRIRAFFGEAGISPHRIDLRAHSRHHAMLAQYGDVDIALDPFPYGGGYTSLEALWMGVPVITMPGDRVVSRQTYSFLGCIDALELVARDPDHYVQLAVELAGDQERLQRYRQELRPRIAASPLCQPERFAEQFTTLLEQAYATIEREHGAAS